MLFFTETTFTNDRQKVEVMVTKQDKIQKILWMEEFLDFMLPVTLKMQMEPVVVKKGTLIQKVTTGNEQTGEVYSRPAAWIFL